MVKHYTSLATARKSLFRQILVLVIAAACVWAGGRLMEPEQFDTNIVLTGVPHDLDAQAIQLEWGGQEIPVEDYKVEHVLDDQYSATVLRLTMKPGDEGRYDLTVKDSDGRSIANDTLFVDHFHNAFSRTGGSFSGDEAFLLAGILFLLGLCVITIVFFFRISGPVMYSYEAILSCGIFLFSLVILILEVPIYIHHLRTPALYPTWQLIYDLASGGKYFALYTFPVLFVFSVLLIISNVELLRHERPRFQNALGLLLGLMIIAAGLVYIWANSWFFQGSYEEYKIVTMAENVIGVIFTYAECLLLGSVICGVRAARHVPGYDRDYIVILGCSFRKDGSLPPLLKGRVDKAMEFWQTQKEKTGKEAVIIPSGGQGSNETMAEAEAMARYMIGRGFPKELIVKENQSANTYQNMAFSKAAIEAREGGDTKVRSAFVTTNYHVFRSGVWAGLAGFEAEGMGSRTKWWFWPNAFVRECVGLVKNRIVEEIIFLILLVGLFAVITMFSYA